MRKLYCYSYQDFKKAMVNGIPNHGVVISIIGSPKIREDETHLFPNGTHVLNLDFDDVTSQDIIKGVKLFDKKSAKEAYKFIDKWVNLGYDFYIHCAAGQSRSQAFVRYIQKHYPGEWETRKENPCQFPNYYVLGMLDGEYLSNYL